MKYIDADALIETELAALKQKGLTSAEKTAYLFAASILKTAKPADVAPVVHAEWVSMTRPHSAEDVCKCSNCGVVVTPYEFWHYCPKCGAKMDAETP